MRASQRFFEIGLWSLGLLCTGPLVVSRLEARASQKAVALIGTQLSPAGQLSVHGDTTQTPAAVSTLLGRLEIPALHLTTPIVDDDDTQSLLRGAGHIRGTAMPGGLGNFVIAAHRDTYFRPLAGIKRGMKIQVVTREETYTYIVDSMKIVNPEDVYVLDTGDVPQLTLITCYPFHYIGAAPQRFTVLAHLAGF